MNTVKSSGHGEEARRSRWAEASESLSKRLSTPSKRRACSWVVVIAGLFDLPDQQIEVRREDPVAGAVKISANQGIVNLALKLSPLTVDFLV